MSLQYRIAPEGQVRDVDDGKRQVQVVIPWEVIDSYKTDFARDCFDAFFAERLPVMCWQHQRAEPIGRVLTRQAGAGAHEMVAQFSDFDAVPRSRQAFAQIRDGEITDFSFGFDQAQNVPHPNVRGARRFTRARMPEISPVTIGAIPGAVAVGIRAEAEVANIRGLLDAGAIDEDEADEMLRAVGLDPLPRQRVEITDPKALLTEAVREVLAGTGERALTITIGDDGTVTTGAAASDASDDDATTDDVSPEDLAQQLDDYCDAADAAVDGTDLSTLPANVQEALHAYAAASVVADELLDAMGIPDDDTDDQTGETAAPDGDERAAMSAKDVNDLPDDDFAYIEPGGEKDAEGKTTPRSLRHFPINDAEHVRNALARASQSSFGDKALPKIKEAAKKFGVDVADDTGKRSVGDVDLALALGDIDLALALQRLNRR